MLPYALTRDIPVLALTRASSMYQDNSFYLQLDFRPGRGTHHETGLCFCGSPFADPDERDSPAEESQYEPGYGATVDSSGRWVDGGVDFCGMSRRELFLEWRLAAAVELNLPQLTLIELRVDDNTVGELRIALRSLFDRDLPDRRRLELAPPSGPTPDQLKLPFP